MYKRLKKVEKKLVVATLAFGLFVNTQTALAAGSLYTLANVNLRSDASTESSVLTLVSAGTQVTVEDTVEEGWGKITFGDMQGYMKTEFIGDVMQVQAEVSPFYSLANVNLRSSASTDSEVLTLTPLGEKITVYEQDANGWSKVLYKDMQGYMKSEFIGNKEQLDKLVGEAKKTTVELTPWSEAKKIVTLGASIKVYDVYSGITYYVKSFSNGKHADVEPVTTDDTSLMKKTYGGRWSWDPRPVWVTVNGKTMAASINGMPHGGGVNGNNGMDGQVCLHFKGSTTHNGNDSFTKLHQQKAIEAYNLSR